MRGSANRLAITVGVAVVAAGLALGGCGLSGPSPDTDQVTAAVEESRPGFSARASVYLAGGGLSEGMSVTVATGGEYLTVSELKDICLAVASNVDEEWLGSISIFFVYRLDPVNDGIHNWVDIRAVTRLLDPSDLRFSTYSVSGSRLDMEEACTEPVMDMTEAVAQQNARESAQSHLDEFAFSRSALIDQLESEGFTYAQATNGVDSLNVDWNEQAALKAQVHLDYSSFSRSALIDQLESEGFTYAQATNGVDSLNVDWNEQAALQAQAHLNYSEYSRSELIDLLEYEGFTNAQAVYGVDQALPGA